MDFMNEFQLQYLLRFAYTGAKWKAQACVHAALCQTSIMLSNVCYMQRRQCITPANATQFPL